MDNNKRRPRRGPSTRSKYRLANEKQQEEFDKNVILVKAKTHIGNYIIKGAEILLGENKSDSVILRGIGNAIPQTIKLSDFLRLRIPKLYQINRVSAIEKVDRYEPTEKYLDVVTVSKRLSLLEIKLTKHATAEDRKEPGFMDLQKDVIIDKELDLSSDFNWDSNQVRDNITDKKHDVERVLLESIKAKGVKKGGDRNQNQQSSDKPQQGDNRGKNDRMRQRYVKRRGNNRGYNDRPRRDNRDYDRDDDRKPDRRDRYDEDRNRRYVRYNRRGYNDRRQGNDGYRDRQQDRERREYRDRRDRRDRYRPPQYRDNRDDRYYRDRRDRDNRRDRYRDNERDRYRPPQQFRDNRDDRYGRDREDRYRDNRDNRDNRDYRDNRDNRDKRDFQNRRNDRQQGQRYNEKRTNDNDYKRDQGDRRDKDQGNQSRTTMQKRGGSRKQ